MSQRIVLIAGTVLVIALVAFSVLRSTHNAPAPAPATMPPMASPRTAAPAPIAEREPTKEEVAFVPRTKPEIVLEGYEAHGLTIIDVRDADSYKERHIPGALHIPLPYIAGEVPYLPKDKPIVTYCT